MLYKFPLRIPLGRRVTLTQGYRSTELAAWYKSQGLNYPVHTAIDVTTGNSVETYGTPFVCPFPEAKGINGLNFVQADPVKGVSGRVIISYKDPQGREIFLGGIHLSRAVYQDVYKEGDVMGYIGNYGPVLPAPTIGKPFDGSHLHMTVVVDGVVTDPLKYFDLSMPYRGYDTGVAFDIPAIQWAIDKIHRALWALGIGAPPARLGSVQEEGCCIA